MYHIGWKELINIYTMTKIAWFSEMGFNSKTPRSHKNMRTEFAWFVARRYAPQHSKTTGVTR